MGVSAPTTTFEDIQRCATKTMTTYCYLPIQLIIPDGKISKKVRDNCIYINFAHYIKRNVVVAPLSDKYTRDKTLDIWTDLEPSEGSYTFEFIVELPFFLPNFKKQFEYKLSKNGKAYVINNRHCELIDEKKNEYMFAHHLSIDSLQEQGHNLHQVIKLKSLISTQFNVKADTASYAVERYMNEWMQIIQKDISNIVSTLRYCTNKGPDLIPDCYNIRETCPVYILCNGKNNKKSMLRFVQHLNASPLQSLSCIEKFSLPKIQKILEGEESIDEGKSLILKGKQLFGSGEYFSACVVTCTACEVIMNKHLKIKLKNKGLGKSKIKEATDNLTFSQLIKLTSQFVYTKNDYLIEFLGKIDKIRKIRNKLVHEGRHINEKDVMNIADVLKDIDIILKLGTTRRST